MSASNITDITTNIISWFSQLGIPQIIILVIIGIFVLKFIFGGHSSSSSNTTVMPSSGSPAKGGFPTSMYTGNSKLSNFSVKPEVYDFKVPSPTPKTDSLRKSANLNMDLASKLFIGNFKNPPKLDIEEAKELFTNTAELPKQTLDWNKARELFIPHLKSEDKEE